MVRALLVVICAGLATSAAAEPWAGQSTMLGGTSRYDGGEWIYQDFVYDDYGADTAPVSSFQVVSLAPTSGDFRYPPDPEGGARYANNAADIAEVRLRRVGDGDLELRVTLGTLLTDDSTVIGVALGDGEPRPWPFEVGVVSPWDRFVTVAAGTVRLTEAGGDTAAIGAAAVDLERNEMSFVIPEGAAVSTLSLTIGAGLWDAANERWLPGRSQLEGGAGEGFFDSGGASDVRVFDLAFNAREREPRGGDWQEDSQSAALAAGDVSEFSQTLDISLLDGGLTDPPIVEAGYYNRIFTSRQNLGEGVFPDAFPELRGRFQPYGLWVPTAYDQLKETPLVLLLHSLGVHHNQYSGEPSYDTMYDEQLDALGALIVTPLGRGPDGWYWDEGLVDTLEVWEDVRAHYAVDDERTSSTGYSMGGYGTYRLTTLLPDRFAAAVSWVGPPAHQLWAWPVLDPIPPGARQAAGNTFVQLENVEHVPFLIIHGTNDELVPVTGVFHQADRLRELGYPHVFDLHPGLDHFAFVFLDEWSREVAWLDGATRTTTPAHVIYKVRPASWATPGATNRETILGHLRALLGKAPAGGVFDSAYWVRDVVVAGDPAADVTGVVDLTSEGVGEGAPLIEHSTTAEPGPPTPFVREATTRTATAAERANALRGTLANVSELTIDLDRAGLTLDGLVIDVTT
ncbi:MAG: prolyl oligopeptidase family serine peptidase, partial [Candidatus Binatia bacterium]